MKVKIAVNCNELSHLLDTPPVPQTHMDLCSLEYRKSQVGKGEFEIAMALFWAGAISHMLKNSRN